MKFGGFWIETYVVCVQSDIVVAADIAFGATHVAWDQTRCLDQASKEIKWLQRCSLIINIPNLSSTHLVTNTSGHQQPSPAAMWSTESTTTFTVFPFLEHTLKKHFSRLFELGISRLCYEMIWNEKLKFWQFWFVFLFILMRSWVFRLVHCFSAWISTLVSH